MQVNQMTTPVDDTSYSNPDPTSGKLRVTITIPSGGVDPPSHRLRNVQPSWL